MVCIGGFGRSSAFLLLVVAVVSFSSVAAAQDKAVADLANAIALEDPEDLSFLGDSQKSNVQYLAHSDGCGFSCLGSEGRAGARARRDAWRRNPGFINWGYTTPDCEATPTFFCPAGVTCCVDREHLTH